MQVKKEELREKILAIAEIEFFNKGFKGASLRTIAKKSNTTLGNIYNYFGSKEELLDEIIGEVPIQIDELMIKHENKTLNLNIKDIEFLNSELDKANPEDFGIDILLTKKFGILMNGCEDTKYKKYREEFIKIMKEHVWEHMKKQEKYKSFSAIVANTFLTSIIFIIKSSTTVEEGRRNFVSLFKLICSGILSQMEEGSRKDD